MVDLDLDKKGSLEFIADDLKINRNSLSMALTGYRNGKATEGYLSQLHKYLMGLLYPEQEER